MGGWPAGWLAGRLADWLDCWLAGVLFVFLADCQTFNLLKLFVCKLVWKLVFESKIIRVNITQPTFKLEKSLRSSLIIFRVWFEKMSCLCYKVSH